MRDALETKDTNYSKLIMILKCTAKHLLTSNKSDLPRFTEDPNPSGAIEIAAIFSSSVAIIVPRLDEVTSDMLPMSEPKW